MSGRARRASRLLVVVAALALAGPAAALPGPVGSLFGDSPAAGCVAPPGDPACAGTAPVAGSSDVAVSPDGRHAYVVAAGSTIVGLTSDVVGAPTLAAAGCISSDPLAPCVPGLGLAGAAAVAVAPDGAHVYVAAAAPGSVAALARDPASGALAQLAAPCVADEVSGETGPMPSQPGCVAVQGLAGATDLALSPDGAHVYVASEVADAVALLVRDPVTGALSQPPGGAGCISTQLIAGDPNTLSDSECGAFAPLDGASAVAVSPDGAHVYVAATGSRAVTTFVRDPSSGVLSVGPCVTHDVGVAGAPTPASPGCTPAIGLGDPTALAVSPDGAHVYVTSALGGAVAAFRRDPVSGALEQLARGCLADPGASAPVGRCASANGLAGASGLAVSPDGDMVYVAASEAGAVAQLARDRSSGALAQLASPHDCVGAASQPGRCRSIARLEGASALALTPSLRHAVVAAAAGVVSLERQLPPACVASSVAGVAGPTAVPLPCFDPNGDSLTYHLLAAPQSGRVTGIDQATGAAIYTPKAGATGRVTFSFAATDADGAAADAAVASIELAAVSAAALTAARARDTRAPLLRSGKLVFDSRRRVRIKLRCPTHERLGCRGTITIKTVRKIPVRILRRARLSAGPRARPTRVVLVRKLRFSIKGAATRTISTSLKKKHLRLLKRIGRTRVDVTVVARDVAGNVAKSKRRVVLQPPKRR